MKKILYSFILGLGLTCSFFYLKDNYFTFVRISCMKNTQSWRPLTEFKERGVECYGGNYAKIETDLTMRFKLFINELQLRKWCIEHYKEDIGNCRYIF